MAKATLLDVHLRKDLSELINGLEISEAVTLNAAHALASDVSKKGLPTYFTGDRKAKTVMVMLNPGGDADVAAEKAHEVQQQMATILQQHA